jgi:NitT/TauT family transport system permease protein
VENEKLQEAVGSRALSEPLTSSRVFGKRLFENLVLILILYVIWWFSSFHFVIPAPSPTFYSLIESITDGWVLPHLASTFRAVGIGFLLAVLVGAGIGLVLGSSPFLREAFEPMILAAYSVPKLIVYPVILLFMGIGLAAQSTMGFIHGAFPIVINTLVAVAEVNPIYLKVGRSVRATLIQTFWKIVLPAIVPAFLVGIRIGFSLSILGVIISELVAAEKGMGLKVMQSYAVFDLPRMYATIIILFSIAIIGNVVFWAFEKKVRGRIA